MFPLHPHDPPTAGAYRLLARLDENAPSIVYLGSAAGRPPARVSVLRSGYATDPHGRETFTRRVEAALRVGGSPNVAPVVDSDLGSPVPWAATERPLGPSLIGLVRAHGPLPITALPTLALGTAQGLAALHEAGHPHGALTPEHVLITEAGALLADPGLAWHAAPGPFDPPEGPGTTSGDVYSWAALLRFAASGTQGPEGGDTLPFQLRPVVDACLREDPDLRPSAADLVDMFGGHGSAAPWPAETAEAVAHTAAHMRDALTEASPARRRRGALLGLTAAALTVTLIVAAGAVWGVQRLSGTDETAAGPDGLITDAGCADGHAFPEPSGPPGALDALRVAFSPDGHALAVSDREHGLTLWDWREGEEIARPMEGSIGGGPLEFAPVGCMVAQGATRNDTGQEFDYQLASTYDLPSGEARDHSGVQPEPGPDGSREHLSLWDLAFNTDGSRLAVSNRTEQGSDLDSVSIIDMTTGEVETTLDAGSVYALAFLDDRRLAGASAGTISLWDVESGAQVDTLRNVTAPRLATVPGKNQIVFVRNDQVHWFDLDEETSLASLSLEEFSADNEDRERYSLTEMAFDPDRGLLHLSWSERVQDADPDDPDSEPEHESYGQLWDFATGENLLADDATLTARSVAHHPEVIAAVDHEGSVALIDPETLEVTSTLG
ncbi:hypothetical protein DSY14_17810 [Nocardiopsis sp. MG754419]|nr:hypothetical protein [Nocardiopsis sp. MG754419]